MDKVPDKLQENIFNNLFEAAEIAKFTPSQVQSYEDSLKYCRDLKNSLDTAKEEGIEEGIEKEKIEVAKRALSKGLSDDVIVAITGLAKEQIDQIKTNKSETHYTKPIGKSGRFCTFIHVPKQP